MAVVVVIVEIGINGAYYLDDDLGVGVTIPAPMFSLSSFIMVLTKGNGGHSWHLGLAYCRGKLLLPLRFFESAGHLQLHEDEAGEVSINIETQNPESLEHLLSYIVVLF